jgi:hypothetical protein
MQRQAQLELRRALAFRVRAIRARQLAKETYEDVVSMQQEANGGESGGRSLMIKDFAGLEKEARGGRRVHACMHRRSRGSAPSAPLMARDEECAAWSYYGVKANDFSRNKR